MERDIHPLHKGYKLDDTCKSRMYIDYYEDGPYQQ